MQKKKKKLSAKFQSFCPIINGSSDISCYDAVIITYIMNQYHIVKVYAYLEGLLRLIISSRLLLYQV